MTIALSTEVFLKSKQNVEEKKKSVGLVRIVTEYSLSNNKKVEVIKGGEYGTSYILFLVNIENTKVKVRSSKLLISELQRKEAYDIPYMISLGQESYGETKPINLYDLVFKKGEKIISLFTSSTLTSTSTSTSPPSQKNE